MNTMIKKVSLCGSGAYGKVYEVKVDTQTTEGDPVSVKNAYKRNLVDNNSSVLGAKSVAELSYLSALRNHPFITQLNQVCMGDPFTKDNPLTPLPKSKNVKEDKFGFLMEFVKETVDVYCSRVDQCTPDEILIMSLQTTIALQYIHARNITHRDIKPTNILVSNCDGDNGIRVRVADFGISNRLNPGIPSTPNTVTVWYRAPEICSRDPNYSTRSDMWSLGCVFYEMITNIPYLYGIRDDNSMAFSEIIRKAESIPDPDVVNNMMQRGAIKLSPNANPIRRKSLYERIRYDRMRFTGDKTGEKFDAFVKRFNSTPGSFDDYVDLIRKLLTIDPAKRMTSSETLNHPAFRGLHSYTSKIHTMCNPTPPNLPIISIVKCIEREWMVEFAKNIYKDRHNIKWYTHRNLFHAMDLFQMYIAWCYNPDNSNLLVRHKETVFSGRIHSRSETHLRFYVIYYLVYKYYVSMSLPVGFDRICPKYLLTYGYDKIAANFEEYFIHTVADNNLYRDTLLEMPNNYSHKLNSEMVDVLFHGYCKIEEWDGMSTRAMYRTILNLDSQGNPKTKRKHVEPLPLAQHNNGITY